MEGFLLLVGLFGLGYPLLAAWIVGRCMRSGKAAPDDALSARIALLEAGLAELERLSKTPPREPAAPAQEDVPATIAFDPLLPRHPPRKAPRPRPQPAATNVIPDTPADANPPLPEAAPVESPPQPVTQHDNATPPPAWVLAVKRWLFTGNLVAKFGLLILFIGVSFLLKYAAERITVPIELRLSGVVLADLGLLHFGWRIRDRRRGIGLPVQGAAIAILMLVVFGAFQRYQLIPAPFAFGLLFMLTAFTCILAVLQDAPWLAGFGICGGFAAPLMVSTGQGSATALFSYYALLNAGVLAIAIKRAWRALNVLGFAFTFVIGTAWGVLKYSAADYPAAQGFPILFLLFYVAVAIAWAARQAPRLKHYVDATLVFAAPVIAGTLQYGLVRPKPFGMALSALALGLFYTMLASVLWRRRGGSMRLLVESFLALGVVFCTLALPFALDARWTSGAWALEGAAMVWIGLRQKQPLTWAFGLLVEVGAWIAFVGGMVGLQGGTNVWLGFLLLAAAAFSMASSFRKHSASDESDGFATGANWLLALASLWLLGGAWGQLIVSGARVGEIRTPLYVGSALAVALLLVALARQSAWRVARAFAIVAQLLAVAALFRLHFFQAWSDGGSSLTSVLMIVVSALVSSRYLDKAALGGPQRLLAEALLWMTAFWWYWPALDLITYYALHMPYVSAVLYLGFNDLSTQGLSVVMLGVALSSIGFALLAKRLAWPGLRRLSIAAWLVLPVWILKSLLALWFESHRSDMSIWIVTAALWFAGDWLTRYWPRQGWTLHRGVLVLLHVIRTAGPLAMVWSATPRSLADRLSLDHWDDMQLLARAGWVMDRRWGDFLTGWILIALLFCLGTRASAARWPTTPVSSTYRHVLLPLAATLALVSAAVLNVSSDGAHAPLPYLPLVNPVDLSTALALLLAARTYPAMTGALAPSPAALARAGKIAFYLWFNLILLRSAAHLLHIDYTFADMFASQAVQAMLSLTWTLSALWIMRRAVEGAARNDRLRRWGSGAVLLAVVVAKLFTVDLANSGSVERIVSFVGVGVLMLVIAYLAPYPTAPASAQSPATIE